MNSPQYTDSNYSEDEGLEDYKYLGYHPVHIGEILLERYLILQKLGYGHFSTAWLALDSKYGNYVAIKIQKSEERYIWAAYDEVEILQELSKHLFDKEWINSLKEYFKNDPEKLKNIYNVENSHVVQLLNSFIYYGQNGRHFCMVFELMGVTLMEIIKKYNYRGLPIPLVRKITKQILIGLDYLHRMCHIIHTDLKPENILVCLTDEELKQIEETGIYTINKKPKNKDENSKNKDYTINDFLNNKKEKDQNNKELLIKRIKNLGRMGIPQEEMELKIKKIMDKNLDDDMENIDENIDNNDLIIRPHVSSVPKIKLSKNNFFSYNLKNNKVLKLNDDDNENDNEYIINCSTFYDIDLIKYSKNLQDYLKDKNRLNHDKNYREMILLKEKIISTKKTETEKLNYMKDIDNYFTDRGPQINSSFTVKICDIGNACWFNHHFSTIIQTRQYRSPEVILGINYNETADIWSLACIIFELVTGEYLFNSTSSEDFCKNDSHLSKFIEICGKMPKNFVERGEYSKKYFDKNGKLIRMPEIRHISLKNLLVLRYHIKENEAQSLTEFIMPMLEYYPEKRISARELLKHPWLNIPPNGNGKLNEFEIFKSNTLDKYLYDDEEDNKFYTNLKNQNFKTDVYSSDSESYEGDNEDNDFYDENDHNKFNKFGDQNPDKVKIPNYKNHFFQNCRVKTNFIVDRPSTQFNFLKKDKKALKDYYY